MVTKINWCFSGLRLRYEGANPKSRLARKNPLNCLVCSNFKEKRMGQYRYLVATTLMPKNCRKIIGLVA